MPIISRFGNPATMLALFLVAAPTAFAHLDTPMGESWEKVEKAYKKLNAGLKAPEESAKDSYVKLAETIREEAGKVRALKPKLLENLPVNEQEAKLEAFQKDMDSFLAEADKLVDSLKKGRWDDARKSMELLHKDKKQGHEAYREKEKK